MPHATKYKHFTQAEIDRRSEFVPLAEKIAERYFYIYWKHRVGVPGKRDKSYGMTYEEACDHALRFTSLRAEEVLNVLLALDQADFDIIKKGAYTLKQHAPTLRTVKVFRPAPPDPIKRIPLSTARPQHQVRRVVNQGRRILRGNTTQRVDTAIGQVSGLSADDLRGGDPGGATSSGEEERLESGVELPERVPPEDTSQPPTDDAIGGSDSGHDSGEMD